jgi:cytochrome c oxidase assembly protein Cox11
MTIFQGSLPRWQYSEATNTQLSGTNAANAVCVTVMERDAFVFSFVNNSDKEIELMLINPDDPSQTKRLFNRIAPGFGFSSSTLNAGGIFTIPAATKIFVHAQGAATSGSSFKMFIWG